MVMAHFRQFGHHPIILVGGATALIGDPSGRSTDRILLTEEQVQYNSQGVFRDLKRVLGLLDFSSKTQLAGSSSSSSPPTSSSSITLENNLAWYQSMNVLLFLRDVGKHFRLSPMLAKDSVKSRLRSEQGMSFTEFSYQALQAHDFHQLFRTKQCTVQIGGSDQWGNITAGVDYVGKTLSADVFGLTVPLLTTASGEKFGKSAGNAVWLDPQRTSPFQFYQFFFRTADVDVMRFLRLFTFMDMHRLMQLEHEHSKDTGKQLAQIALAEHITRLVHGETGLAAAQRASRALFGAESFASLSLSSEDVMDIFAGVPLTQVTRNQIANGLRLTDAVVLTKICNSKGEAKRLISSRGLSINNEVIQDISRSVSLEDFIEEKICVLRSGKRNYFLLQLI